MSFDPRPGSRGQKALRKVLAERQAAYAKALRARKAEVDQTTARPDGPAQGPPTPLGDHLLKIEEMVPPTAWKRRQDRTP